MVTTTLKGVSFMVQAQSQIPDLLPQLETTTPLMAQYHALKARHQDCLLFFRLGDFYELFFDDALKASRALDITLTRRGQHQGREVPMCGVPAHAYEGYVAKLIRLGFRVALCEQTEDPAAAKKRGGKSIVTREVVRIVTPGTLTEDNLLEAKTANYLACLTMQGDTVALAWLDLAAGVPMTEMVTLDDMSGLLSRVDPVEIVLPENLLQHSALSLCLAPWRDKLRAEPQSRFDSTNALHRLKALYRVTDLEAFGTFSRPEIMALGALLDYVALTQNGELVHLARPRQQRAEGCLILDPATRRNLELTRTLAGERDGSLLATLDRTKMGCGARLLAARLVAPLRDVAVINARLDAVAFGVDDKNFRTTVREILGKTPDLERPLARLALQRGGPRDLAAVKGALEAATHLHETLALKTALPTDLLQLRDALAHDGRIVAELKRALLPDLPLLTRDGNFIAPGYSADLDQLITLRDDGRRLITNLQQKYVQASGVSNLKIRHNQVLGYYIEVTPTQADRLLANKELFIHRQSLTTAARFTTVELGTLEQKIAEASDKALALEMEFFARLVESVILERQTFRRIADALAALDVTTALAELAVEEGYVRPLVDTSLVFSIHRGRHPVVEPILRVQEGGAAFVANDCDLAPERRLWLLTGPNMAGKSTFLRQNALITLLAQMGSFVPAEAAHIGVVDRLFSRVGAADDLARGRSTFMVEMVETAGILHQAGERALVILDEIGRGTATHDGLSIAWATLEHLHGVNRCRTLFATHYHELTQLSEKLPALSCHTMRIKEWEGTIIFLHEVIAGTADRSYGIHVAQMAGLPPAVITRAEEVLAILEKGTSDPANISLAQRLHVVPRVTTVSQRDDEETAWEKKLRAIKPDELSPKEALETLYEIKSLLAVRLRPKGQC